MKDIKRHLGFTQREWLQKLLTVPSIPTHYKATISDVISKDWYNENERYLLNLLRNDYGKSH